MNSASASLSAAKNQMITRSMPKMTFLGSSIENGPIETVVCPPFQPVRRRAHGYPGRPRGEAPRTKRLLSRLHHTQITMASKISAKSPTKKRPKIDAIHPGRTTATPEIATVVRPPPPVSATQVRKIAMPLKKPTKITNARTREERDDPPRGPELLVRLGDDVEGQEKQEEPHHQAREPQARRHALVALHRREQA